MSIKKHAFQQGMAILQARAGVNGVCLELARRWVKAQLTLQWKAGDTIYDWTDMSTGEFTNVLEKHAARGTLGDVGIENYPHVASATRSVGCCTFEGLRRREDVINYVMTLPGVYIYAVTDSTDNGAGHAFCFDTRNPNKVAFFDPNQGEFIFKNESLANMRDWWDRFWDASGKADTDGDRNYKKAFNKGGRDLFKYNVPPDRHSSNSRSD